MVMIIRAQFHSSSKLKQFLPLTLSSYHTFAKPLPIPISYCHALKPQQTPFPQNPTKTLTPLKPQSLSTLFRPFSSQPIVTNTIPTTSFCRDGNYDEATSKTFLICPGCGVHMQHSDTKLPGFYINPSTEQPNSRADGKNPLGENPQNNANFQTLEPTTTTTTTQVISSATECGEDEKYAVLPLPKSDCSQIPLMVKTYEGNCGEVPLSCETREKNGANLPKEPLVCSGCHWLRFHGIVRGLEVDNLLPEFNFDETVGRRLSSILGAPTVVLLVVDALDFDGSFPRGAASFISKTFDDNDIGGKEEKSGNAPKVVLVVTKIDLLPGCLTAAGVEYWVRIRAREGGASKLASVHLVSALKDWGVENLVNDVVGLVGERGHVWVVGAQNTGKSALINAIGRSVGANATRVTESMLPGTTLGIIRVEGVLPGNVKMFDTPGILHQYQLMSMLTGGEKKFVHICRELIPRTYRITAGHSVHIAGLMRLDIEESSADYVYVTVWASNDLPLHMGKTKDACKIFRDLSGIQLKPPLGKDRVKELGKWVRKEFRISCIRWDLSSVDIAAAGLGWFAVGLQGEARLGAWTYEGVDVIVRKALIPQRPYNYEVAGYKGAHTKLRIKKKKVVNTLAPNVSSSSSS